MIKKILLLIFFISLAFSFSYSGENIRVLFVNTTVFKDGIIFSIKIENRSEENIYILLDYILKEIKYCENISAVVADISGKPFALEYDNFIPSDYIMPNINIVAPGQKQLFNIIIKNYEFDLKKGIVIMQTILKGLQFFKLEPPNIDFWGSSVSNPSYKLYADFYQDNAIPLSAWH